MYMYMYICIYVYKYIINIYIYIYIHGYCILLYNGVQNFNIVEVQNIPVQTKSMLKKTNELHKIHWAKTASPWLPQLSDAHSPHRSLD